MLFYGGRKFSVVNDERRQILRVKDCSVEKIGTLQFTFAKGLTSKISKILLRTRLQFYSTVRDPIKRVLFKGHLSRNLKVDPINP